MADVGAAMQRAIGKTDDMQARAAAVEELQAAGTFEDLTALGRPQDDVDRQLHQLGAKSAVEDELAKLKAQVGPRRPPVAARGRGAGRHRRAGVATTADRQLTRCPARNPCRSARRCSAQYLGGMCSAAPPAASDRVNERRRAVALARHFREAEGLSIVQIADRLGRSPATIKAYFYDPTGEKAQAVKARYQGVCRGCGACTQPRNGKGDAYRYCKRCHPGAIEQKWDEALVIEAMLDWLDRYGRLPSSYDWSRTHAKPRGGVALERLDERAWPSASLVGELFGSWRGARGAAVDATRTAISWAGRPSSSVPASPPLIDARTSVALGQSNPVRDA
jgi:hypothetical protein